MSATNGSAKARPSGFEMDGDFFPWHVTDRGYDLILIDRLTGLAPHEFFDAVSDDVDRLRGPILLALMATSIRNRKPQISIERILRIVENVSIGEVEFVGGDDDEEVVDARPPDGKATDSTPRSSATSKTPPVSPSPPPSVSPR